jgi:hypothetical protein
MGLADDPVGVISVNEAETLVDAVVDHQCPLSTAQGLQGQVTV